MYRYEIRLLRNETSDGAHTTAFPFRALLEDGGPTATQRRRLHGGQKWCLDYSRKPSKLLNHKPILVLMVVIKHAQLPLEIAACTMQHSKNAAL